jgi:hypothetical protein
MSEDSHCQHLWGTEPELVETAFGEVHSPLCEHCGAVKLIEEHRASERRRADFAARLINLPAAAPERPRVHAHQTQIFPDV